MAGGAGLDEALALLGIRLGEQDRQGRDHLWRSSGGGGAMALFGRRQRIAGLGHVGGREEGVGDDAKAHEEEEGAEHRAGDLVELERIHACRLRFSPLHASARARPVSRPHGIAVDYPLCAPLGNSISSILNATFCRLSP